MKEAMPSLLCNLTLEPAEEQKTLTKGGKKENYKRLQADILKHQTSCRRCLGGPPTNPPRRRCWKHDRYFHQEDFSESG